MVHEVSCTLDSRICQFAYFLAVETIPPPSIEFFVKIKDELGMNEVNKSIADIT
jgi:hypothetical protein